MLSKSLSVGERRNSTRLKLTSAVRIHRRGELQAVETVTEDLSSEGFYCISERPFSPHEWLECELTISSAQPSAPLDKGLVLRCTAEVVRLLPAGPRFGLACRFENYSLTPLATRQWEDFQGDAAEDSCHDGIDPFDPEHAAACTPCVSSSPPGQS
jgi:hypothetical protein